jgi:hypothetical protein
MAPHYRCCGRVPRFGYSPLVQTLAIRRLVLALGLAALLFSVRYLSPPAMATPQTPAGTRWLKGNTHTHTTESDGDSSPDDVARWYREHGYDFLVLSDHNKLTSVDALNALAGADGKFLLIKGEEVTDKFEAKHVHVNALDISERVDPQKGNSIVEVIQRNVDAIRRAGGVPHINHPNFYWSLSVDDLIAVRNYRLLEIFNGHPHVNNLGGGGFPDLEQMWDAILSSGMLVYGIAVDDAHTFKQPGNPAVAGPGRGWVVVRTNRLDGRAIVSALENGDFYASTGVTLDDYVVTAKSMTVTVRKDAWAKYRVQFIGHGGRVLHEALDSPAEYVFKGGERYVRARVLESNGRVAWCQPVRINAN